MVKLTSTIHEVRVGVLCPRRRRARGPRAGASSAGRRGLRGSFGPRRKKKRSATRRAGLERAVAPWALALRWIGDVTDCFTVSEGGDP